MTIALGLVCENGLVLGADREMSRGTMKHRERKAHIVNGTDFEIGVVGAGSASLITYAVQELDRRLVPSMTADAVRLMLENIAAEIQKRHIDTNPAAQHELDLLVGIKTPHELVLLNVAATIVTVVKSYETIGSGGDLARYILSHLYAQGSHPTVLRGVILAAHVLRETKQSAQYCGGESDVIFIQRGSHVGFVPENDIYEHERTTDRFGKIVQPVMLALTDINVLPPKLDALIGQMVEELHTVRTTEFLQKQAGRFDQILIVEPLHVADVLTARMSSERAEPSPMVTENQIISDVVAPPSPDTPLLYEAPSPSPAPPEDDDG